jgi:hypothetical protein
MLADDRLEDLEAELRNGVDSVLLLDFDLGYWAAHNEPSADNLRALDRVFYDVFRDLIHQYRNTALEAPLVACRAVLSRVAWAAVNVPFPHDTQTHLEAVSDNVLHTWIDMFYADIRTEMVVLDHHAQVIQRNWKAANTNPAHPVCRRRLLHEFDSLRDE